MVKIILQRGVISSVRIWEVPTAYRKWRISDVWGEWLSWQREHLLSMSGVRFNPQQDINKVG